VHHYGRDYRRALNGGEAGEGFSRLHLSWRQPDQRTTLSSSRGPQDESVEQAAPRAVGLATPSVFALSATQSVSNGSTPANDPTPHAKSRVAIWSKRFLWLVSPRNAFAARTEGERSGRWDDFEGGHQPDRRSEPAGSRFRAAAPRREEPPPEPMLRGGGSSR